jgi:hypothetical protein
LRKDGTENKPEETNTFVVNIGDSDSEQSPKKVRNQGTRFRGRFGKVRKVLV